jgi:hypothetical protein
MSPELLKSVASITANISNEVKSAFKMSYVTEFVSMNYDQPETYGFLWLSIDGETINYRYTLATDSQVITILNQDYKSIMEMWPDDAIAVYIRNKLGGISTFGVSNESFPTDQRSRTINNIEYSYHVGSFG